MNSTVAFDSFAASHSPFSASQVSTEETKTKMWRTGIILIGVLCQLVSWLNACTAIKDENTDLMKSCDTTLVDNEGYLHIQCYFHSSIGSFAIGVITTFKTKQPLARDRSLKSSECLLMAHGRLMKINPDDVEQYLEKSTDLKIPSAIIYVLMDIKDIDINVKFQSEKVVGKVNYDPSCIRQKRQPHALNNRNISECINEVRALNSTAALFNSVSQFRKFDPHNINVIKELVGYVDKLWIDKYGGTVPNATLSLYSEYATPIIAKEAIATLEKRQLEALHLPNNHFEKLGNDDLPALPKLKTLDFSNCRLRSIEPLAFQSMTNLIHLNLAGNQFQHIPQALTPLISLQILNMSSNRIVNAPETSNLHDGITYTSLFIHFPQLRSLDLSNNGIDMFASFSMDNDIDEHPRLMNLSGNKIQTWDQPKLNVTPSLQLEIDVTRNKISKVTPAMVTDFSMLNHVYLSGNPFDCDSCHLSIFQEWLSTNGTPNDHDSNPYKCSSPIESAGLDVIKVRIDTEVSLENKDFPTKMDSCSSATSLTLSSFSRLWFNPGKQGIWTSSQSWNIIMMLHLCMIVLSIKPGFFTI